MDAVELAKSGHPGMPMGIADAATVLFKDFLKFDAADPHWPDRDRFILSAGHGSMLLYSLLYLTGYKDMTIEDIKNFRQLGSKTAGHPEYGFASGIETTTGPLGQGLGNSVGFAIAEAILRAEFGKDLINHYTYVIAGDGCLMEGISQEAITLAGHLKLSHLIVLYDDNSITIEGSTSLSTSEDTLARFKAAGWDALSIDGHDYEAISNALKFAKQSPFPTLIACKTKIGYGAPTKEGSHKVHGSPLGAEEIEKTRQHLSWPYAPFEIPDEILKTWREIGRKGSQERLNWQKRLQETPSDQSKEFKRRFNKELPSDWQKAIQKTIQEFLQTKPSLATRQCSQKVLENLVPILPELVGGSADLSESTNTKVAASVPITPEHFKGNYIYYGIREHGMAACMNGLALHGGIIPYGSTFLVFSDYLRPSLRLSALMQAHVIYVFTHDSIGLGEDGPTHQPIEHLACLRAIPNVYVFRPCDSIETAECWAAAIQIQTAPSAICLSRQSLPTVRQEESWTPAENKSLKGAYVLKETSLQKRVVTLLVTGSEVSLALKAQTLLEEKSIGTAVVSVPCTKLFDEQDISYKESVLKKDSLRLSIEAGISMGWSTYTGSEAHHIGLTTFGASGKGEDVMGHFGLTPEAIVEKTMSLLS